MAEKIRVVIVPTGKRAYIAEIEHTLENLQKLVGGCITASYPFDDEVAVICDDEGMYKHQLNRWVDEYTGWFGDFIITGLTEENFGSLTEAQAKKYKDMFKYPELFVKIGAQIIRIKDGSKEKPRVIMNCYENTT